MAIVVKTYPDIDATSYISLEEFKEWAAQNLKDLTGRSDDQLSVALNSASEYMDTRFEFVGYRKHKEQLREWPREAAWDNRGDKADGIPRAVKQACLGFAFLSLSRDLMPGLVADESGRVVKSKDEKVGPISTSVEYDTSAGYDMPTYPAIDKLLYRQGLVKFQGGLSVGTIWRS